MIDSAKLDKYEQVALELGHEQYGVIVEQPDMLAIVKELRRLRNFHEGCMNIALGTLEGDSIQTAASMLLDVCLEEGKRELRAIREG